MGSYAALGIAWLGLVVLSWSARLGPWRLTRGSLIALPFALAALPLVVTRGDPALAMVDLGPLTVRLSAQGVREFTTILAKSWISVQAALLLTYTTPFHDLVDGLRELRLPRVMVAIISFMYRYLGVLTGEVARMNRARAARSADRGDGRAGGTLHWRARVTGAMVGSLFLRSYERSERIYAAMQARGFDGDLRYMAGPPLSTRAIAVFGLALAALVAFEVAAHLWGPRL